jgi:hypothetical protein
MKIDVIQSLTPPFQPAASSLLRLIPTPSRPARRGRRFEWSWAAFPIGHANRPRHAADRANGDGKIGIGETASRIGISPAATAPDEKYATPFPDDGNTRGAKSKSLLQRTAIVG